MPERRKQGRYFVTRTLQLSLVMMLVLGLSALAQDKPVATAADKPASPSAEEEAAALQKATQNPVANLISVPIQNNSNFNYGPYDRTDDAGDEAEATGAAAGGAAEEVAAARRVGCERGFVVGFTISKRAGAVDAAPGAPPPATEGDSC